MAIHESNARPISLVKWRRAIFLALTSACLVTWGLASWARPNDAVPYPTGYRHWTHVKSSLVGPKHPNFEREGGFHHTYANEKALEGYRTGKFPDGSTLVDDGLESKETANGALIEGPRRRVAVMLKDSKRYAETGGWGYEVFKGDSQTERLGAAEVVAKCFACHGQQKERDSVFSEFRK
jgi:hypothetical protein